MIKEAFAASFMLKCDNLIVIAILYSKFKKRKKRSV